MNIISGSKKGHKIIAPNTNFRPTQSKVRSAFFNIVNVEGKSFLDLCAASAAMSLEALSLGASQTTSIDIDSNAIKTMFKNFKNIYPQNNNYIIKKYCANDFVKRTKEHYDIIFFDPPYFANLYEKVIKTIFDRQLLNDGGTFVAETSIEYYTKSKQTLYDNYKHSIRKYGTTVLVIFS